ncbi:elongation factor P [Candidatus Contubernalis alkaliaceticus]|uniref:elongation factor P n=1 Tax=Candidatus Contubernalis alkaliaceticus TaxID=338645 RepID=UPI001F4C1B9D|nr:elongation factor P [Candidatus Contubernalis alkalaceticus]UNC92559.1 elongation factor P [Candidatus Contubernalis alkalaceticus]
MISTNDFRTGLTIELEGQVYTVVEFQHVKPGKGAAFVRTKLKNLQTGAVTEKTFRAGEKVSKAHIERKTMQYLYNTGEDFIFMDLESYEQLTVDSEKLGDTAYYLKENMEADFMMYQGLIMGVEVPNFVELTVTETDPGYKGDTASGGSKPATLETGLIVQVPFFINIGDVLKVNTKNGEYMERV